MVVLVENPTLRPIPLLTTWTSGGRVTGQDMTRNGGALLSLQAPGTTRIAPVQGKGLDASKDARGGSIGMEAAKTQTAQPKPRDWGFGMLFSTSKIVVSVGTSRTDELPQAQDGVEVT